MEIRIPRETLREIFTSLCEVEDINSAHAVFFKAGKKVAPLLGEKIDEIVKNMEDMGWGKIKVKKLKDKYKFELEGTLFSDIRSDKGVCAFYAGVFAGAIEKEAKTRTVVVERSCIGKGDSKCIFETVSP